MIIFLRKRGLQNHLPLQRPCKNRVTANPQGNPVQHKGYHTPGTVGGVTTTKSITGERHYFKLGEDKPVDSQANLRLALAERRHGKQSSQLRN